jgi:hypothetical protein
MLLLKDRRGGRSGKHSSPRFASKCSGAQWQVAAAPSLPIRTRPVPFNSGKSCGCHLERTSDAILHPDECHHHSVVILSLEPRNKNVVILIVSCSISSAHKDSALTDADNFVKWGRSPAEAPANKALSLTNRAMLTSPR